MDLATAPADRDADILAALAGGRTEAGFELLARRYAARVHRLCLTLLRDPGAAEDAAQDALLRCWQALDRFDPARAALSTWLYAITRNRCLSLLAQRAGRPAADPAASPDGGSEDEDDPGRFDRPLPGSGTLQWPDPTDPHARERLRAAVEALPEARRQCVLLYYYEERALSEVALMLGCPEGTVKTHLHRARAQLLQDFQRQNLGESGAWL